MKNQIDDVLNSKISKKQFLIPLITIIAFVLVIGGVSYAYFGFTSVTNNVIYANVSTPEAVNKSLQITKTDCSLTVNMEDMQYGNASNTTPITNSSCILILEMNGSVGDYCTYNVILENASNPAYSPSVTLASNTYEYKGEITFVEINIYPDGRASYTTPLLIKQDQMNVLTQSDIASSEMAQITDSDRYKQRLYLLDTSFYNLVGVDQKALIKSTTGTTTYKHQLIVEDLNCNWNH